MATDVSIFINASASRVKNYVLTEMLFVAILNNKRKRKASERTVFQMLEFIKSKKWKYETLPDRALNHIKKHNLKIHDAKYYKRMIELLKS